MSENAMCTTEAAAGARIGNMRLDDMDAVAELARLAWFSGEYHGVQDEVARFFVAHHLERASWARVARLGQEIVGVMLARVEGQPAVCGDYGVQEGERLRQVLCQSEQGRHFLDVFTGYRRDHQEMEADARATCEAECQMYIVNPNKQGQGIGRLLWDDMMNYFASHGARQYFLYTDTDCNWRIYEAKGLARSAERHDMGIDGIPTYSQFVYVGEVN